ncbi:MAG: bifunctional chorismate mutase/prephenate dehydratase [Acidobacteriota bacterium]
MSSRPELQALREEIEDFDRRILTLLRDRMEAVERIARKKLEVASPFRDQQREDVVLSRVRGLAVELGLDAHGVERIYRQLLEMSISHQQAHVRGLETVPLRVTYQGVEGSYSHLTARRRYGGRPGGVLLTGFASVRDAVEEVRTGRADLALLPIENSTAGSINETYDVLADGELVIHAEVVSRIEHCLLVLPGATLEGLRRVLSHPQALAQCAAFLATTPWIAAQAEFDTAGSAHKVADGGDPTVAAIASRSAGERFGLEVLRSGIEMQRDNATRFVEVALEASPCPADAPCKTSLLLWLDHRAGALAEVLGEFARRSIRLAKLESRPIGTDPWRYRFYVDVEAHADAAPMVEALDRLRELAPGVRVLGTYPQAAAAQPASLTEAMPEKPSSVQAGGASGR